MSMIKVLAKIVLTANVTIDLIRKYLNNNILNAFYKLVEGNLPLYNPAKYDANPASV
ncbi:3417_t:CDS:2 [Funneliformis mosseae]|uniref:3417_t:CDS:1 n=1 Tax=Funneliformis mosseae TaxID=27381 RepID=A0A9N9AJB6_FUNMO|nr:3417_t:CDS:2 [Funneliformis mosseae]